jgi:thiol-disulfide isomerase/thioredoxin
MDETRRQIIRASAAALVATKLIQDAAAQSRPPAFGGSYGQFVEIEPREDVSHIALTGLDGKRRLLSSYRGQSVLLSFWASWCAPCRRELPTLHELGVQAKRNRRSFAVVPVSLDRDVATARGFLDRLHLATLNSFIDSEGEVASGPKSKVATPFPLYGLPMSYIIDAQGRSAGYLVGDADWNQPSAVMLLQHYARM